MSGPAFDYTPRKPNGDPIKVGPVTQAEMDLNASRSKLTGHQARLATKLAIQTAYRLANDPDVMEVNGTPELIEELP